MQTSLWQKYKNLLQAGKIQPDPMQESLAGELQIVFDQLLTYHPKQNAGIRGAVNKWRGGAVLHPKGLYIHGPVGRGKSLLMDLFFQTIPVPQKKRVHFHAFMQDVHTRLHRMRLAKPDLADPLPVLAAQLAEEAWLLCFDEFVVQDIADAMILSRLFSAMFDCGVVVIATSNVAPRDLYLNGLQRERFLSFIDILLHHVRVFEYQGGVDYRTQKLREIDRYNAPLNAHSAAILSKAFAALTDNAMGEATTISVKGHDLMIRRTAKGVAFAAFADLCEGAYGAGDYLALAEQFHTVILSDVPQFQNESRNEAKRFTTLIDVLYDKHKRFICSAAVAATELWNGENRPLEWDRTVSRLLEMQSAAYQNETDTI